MSLDLWLYVPVDTGDPETKRLVVPDAECFNITHNVSKMWERAGVYTALYKSEGEPAGSLLEVLRTGIKDMENYPEKYRILNPANGWGDYEGALDFLRSWTAICAKHPKALIGVSR